MGVVAIPSDGPKKIKLALDYFPDRIIASNAVERIIQEEQLCVSTAVVFL